MRAFAFVIVAALTLGGCVQTVGTGTGVNTTIVNPVTRNELATIERSYAIAATAVKAYRRLGQCRRGQVETFERPCYRRDVMLQLQAADRTAYAALREARAFVRNNPTLNAFSVLAAARSAVDNLRLTMAQRGVA